MIKNSDVRISIVTGHDATSQGLHEICYRSTRVVFKVIRTVSSSSGGDESKDVSSDKKQSFREALEESLRNKPETEKAGHIFQRLRAEIDLIRQEEKEKEERLMQLKREAEEDEKRGMEQDGLDREDVELRKLLKEIVPERPKVPKSIISVCRTKESNPAKHTYDHNGLFYTVPEADADRWLNNSFRNEYYSMAKAIGETAIMVREPALETINYIKTTDYSMPVIRYIMFGRRGAGKSVSMGQVMHYCGHEKWMVIHVKWPGVWCWHSIDVTPSTYRPERYDTPKGATNWLLHFKRMNEHLMKSLDLRISHKYVWNQREASEVGDPWLDVIEYGLSRPKYSCDVVGSVLKEARTSASEGKFKLLVAIDGANAFFGGTRYKKELTRENIIAAELSLIHNFKKLTENNWTGGAIVLTVDEGAAGPNIKGSYLPKFLLQERGGFEFYDPHIPIHVHQYNDMEMHSCINYYLDTKWITNPHGSTVDGKDELVFMSCKNPMELYNVSRSW